MVTLFTSLPDLSVVFFSLFCLFVFVVCLVLFLLVAAAFLANKDVYILYTITDSVIRLYGKYFSKCTIDCKL